MSQPPAELIHVTVEWPDRTTAVVAVSGEVDMETVDELRAGLAETVAVASTLVVDLTGVGFLGSVGLSALVETQETATGRDCRLILVADQHPVLRPLQATGLDAHFTIRASQTEALAVGKS